MSQTVLEINAKNSDKKNTNNSYFSQVFGEPIKCSAGSTIDFLNGFLDLGVQSQDDYIYIANKFQLGINFYRYEYDVPQLPASQGTDGAVHSKRFIYWHPASQDTQDPGDATIIDQKIPDPVTFINRPVTQYGARSSFYGNTNLPAFMCKRVAVDVTPLPDGSKQRQETFMAEEETSYIDIPAGYYSKVKFCQIVNDQFNLLRGSLVNADKPLETFTTPNPPTNYTYDVTPLDYQQVPNVYNDFLKSYEYGHAQASVVGPDPDGINDKTNIYTNDLTWDYWFCPVYTIPTDPTYYVEEGINPPYIWYQAENTGFMAGTSKFNINYDTDNDLFYIDYCHSPMLDTEQREVVLFSKAQIRYSQLSNTGYKARGALGGALISRLFSYDYDSTGNPILQNTGFWQKILGFGFDDAYQTQFKADFQTKDGILYNNGVQQIGNDFKQKYGVTYKFIYNYPDTKYLDIATTNPLIPLQWLQQSNFAIVTADKGMAIYSKDIAKIMQSVGNRVINGDQSGQAYTKPDPYYLIDINISHVKNDNYRDRDSYRQIMSIAGKTYQSGTNYIQLFGDNSIQALNLLEDIYIDKIEIKILNADKTEAVGLGDNTSIFLRITQPVIMEKK
jgi:hypothetical protein